MDYIQQTYLTEAILDIETMGWEGGKRVPYSGPWALCDRAASNESKNAENTAENTAGSYGSAANAASSALTPFYRQEMSAQHGFNPNQINELMNAAEAPLASSAATAAGQAASEGARTRNTSGFSSALDQAARERQSALGQAGLNVGMADVMGAKQLNQEGAAGLSGLYGQDVNAQLGAMGLQNQDINTQINAGKSGWLQNTYQGIDTAANLIKAVKGV